MKSYAGYLWFNTKNRYSRRRNEKELDFVRFVYNCSGFNYK